MTKTIAVVLSGAVAQGAFEAGALKILAGKDVKISRVVSASAGSLNAIGLAAGVRARGVDAMADLLIDLWQNHADWGDVFSLNPLKWLPFRGLSDQTKLLQLLKENLRPAPLSPDAPPISLCMVVAPLAGRAGEINGPDGRPMTTYERMIEFKDADFDNPITLYRACEVAVASAAFPGVFAPYDLGTVGTVQVGQCIDGGSTNNTPIQYALDAPDELDEIVVINPTVATVDTPLDGSALEGVGLASQIGQMLINERLYRDLYAIERADRQIQNLKELVPNTLSLEQYNAVLKALAVTGSPTVLPRIFHPLQIRPLQPLPGNAFSGFRSSDDRAAYVKIGQERAEAMLDSWE